MTTEPKNGLGCKRQRRSDQVSSRGDVVHFSQNTAGIAVSSKNSRSCDHLQESLASVRTAHRRRGAGNDIDEVQLSRVSALDARYPARCEAEHLERHTAPFRMPSRCHTRLDKPGGPHRRSYSAGQLRDVNAGASGRQQTAAYICTLLAAKDCPLDMWPLELQVRRGDLTKQHNVVAIVNLTNLHGHMSGGVSKSIEAAARPDFVACVQPPTGLLSGQASVSILPDAAAKQLGCQCVLHVAVPHATGKPYASSAV